MAKKKPLKKDYPPRNRVYPWNQWSDGQWHELKAGVDFKQSMRCFRAQVLFWARSHGKLGETRKLEDGVTLAVRFSALPPGLKRAQGRVKNASEPKAKAKKASKEKARVRASKQPRRTKAAC